MRPPSMTTGDCHKLLFLVSAHPAFQVEDSDLQETTADIWDLMPDIWELLSVELEYFAKIMSCNLNWMRNKYIISPDQAHFGCLTKDKNIYLLIANG